LDAEAAAAGGFIPAVVGKMGALYDAACEALEPTGIYESVAADFEARWSTRGSQGSQDLWERMIEDERGSFLLIVSGALKYIGATPTPSSAGPWPIEFAAAHVLVDLFVLSTRVRDLRRELVGRDTVDLQGFAEVVWISLRLGAMGEAFRAERYGFASAIADAQRIIKHRKAAQQNGGARTKANADAWRLPALEAAQRMRAVNPTLTQLDVALKIELEAPGAPGVPRIISVVRDWERQYRSTGGTQGLRPRSKTSEAAASTLKAQP